MKKTKVIQKKISSAVPRIKVKLDSRTTIMLLKMSSLKIWKLRFPDAKIIS